MKEYRTGCVSVITNAARSEGKGPEFLSEAAVAPAHRIHRGHPAYRETPLRKLDAMAVDQAPTIMAGLNCGEPCTIAWPILRDFADWYFKCPDCVSAYGMRPTSATGLWRSRTFSL